MKANRLVSTFLLFFAIAVQLPAQQSEADRKLFEEVRIKAGTGDVVAQFFVGYCYFSGQGVKKDEAEAVKWYRKAADQGIADSQYNLGICYAKGEGVAQDITEAVNWYRKAADGGFAMAQSTLGACYMEGYGVTKSETEAVNLFRKAANQGYAEAQTLLGTCYVQSLGVSRDLAQALKWYQRAADQGHASAQACLGNCYRFGTGVPINDIEAYKWLSLAIAGEAQDQFLRLYGEFLNSAAVRMSRPEIAEAQRLARQFRPRVEGVFSTSGNNPFGSGTGFFITQDGFLISSSHVVEGVAQVRLVTSAGLISAKVVKVDAANDLALLKAEGRFAALPVAASRGVKLGGTVATVGFPNIGLQGFAPKLAKGGRSRRCPARGMTRGISRSACRCSRAIRAGRWWTSGVPQRGMVGVVSAKLSARAALAASRALPENVNYAVKSSFLLGFLESVPEVSAKFKEPETKERKFEDVVKSAEQAAVLVLVY